MNSEPPPVAFARFTERADVAAIGTARRRVTAFAAEHGMAGERRLAIAIAVSEAVTNTVRHAYPDDEVGDVVIDLATDGEWLTVRVADHGPGAQDPDASLGLGVQLMTKVADRVELAAGPGGVGTVALMEFPMRVTEQVASNDNVTALLQPLVLRNR